jgi:hypothetical protein
MKPFKVICVKEFNNADIKQEYKSAPRPDVGDICEVFDVVNDGIPEVPYYKLYEFPGYGYRYEHFATLPERDADEMREEVRESIVNLETSIV